MARHIFCYLCVILNLSSQALRENNIVLLREVGCVNIYWVWGEGMKNDKIFRKQPALAGCYPAQPGSILMTPFARKGDWPHKLCMSGVGGGMGGRSRPLRRPRPRNRVRALEGESPDGRCRASGRGGAGFCGRGPGRRVRRPGPASSLLRGLRSVTYPL